ncbi:MAG: hypothetical protein C4325_11055 [Blastocatellia bacterium]
MCAAIAVVLSFSWFAFEALAHGNHNRQASNGNSQTSAAATSENAPVNATSDQTKDASIEHGRMEQFATFHPLVVHFPIVLLIIAACFQIISLFVFRREFGMATFLLAVLGTLGAFLASNVFHPHTAELSASAADLLTRHEYYADLTVWLGAAGAIAKLGVLLLSPRVRWAEAFPTVLLVCAAVAVGVAGHHGAELVHKEGIGPQGRFLQMHDH